MHPYRKSAIQSAGFIIFIGWLVVALTLVTSIIIAIEREPRAILAFAGNGVGFFLIAAGHIVRLLALGNGEPPVSAKLQPAATAPTAPDPEIIPEPGVDQKKMIAELHRVISEEKDKMVPGGVPEINQLLEQLITGKQSFRQVNNYYIRQFGISLEKHLVSVSSHYTQIYQYVEPLIQLGICRKEYPHDLIP